MNSFRILLFLSYSKGKIIKTFYPLKIYFCESHYFNSYRKQKNGRNVSVWFFFIIIIRIPKVIYMQKLKVVDLGSVGEK